MKPALIYFLLLGIVSLNLVGSNRLFAQDETYNSVFIVKKTTLWSEPTRFREPLAELFGGLKVAVIEFKTNSKWVKVQTPDSRIGWVQKKFTSLEGRRDEPLVKDADGQDVPEKGNFKDINLAERDFTGEWALSFGVEYANQITLSQTHGFGLQNQFYYHLSPILALGTWVAWDRFKESADSDVDNVGVKRVAHRTMMGVMGRFYQTAFALDVGVGVELMKSTFTLYDSQTKEALSFDEGVCGGISADGKSSDSAMALSLAPAFRFPMGRNAVLETYLQWSTAFYGGTALCGQAGKNPQQISAGSRLLFLF